MEPESVLLGFTHIVDFVNIMGPGSCFLKFMIHGLADPPILETEIKLNFNIAHFFQASDSNPSNDHLSAK